MSGKKRQIDLLVVGAGPAGCAAAIRARQAGLTVVMLEASAALRRAPGETLHPGVEPILAQLGVAAAVSAASCCRHRGLWLEAREERRFEAYGEDERGRPWLGFQVERERLHGILLKEALDRGMELIRPTAPSAIIKTGARVSGVVVDGQEYLARWVADATGRRAWLARELELQPRLHSPPLYVRFGWRALDVSDLCGQPLLRFHRRGWDWCAPLSENQMAWVALRIAPRDGQDRRAGGIDLTWRIYSESAGPGYFLLGDAAALLDPSSSSGVLRALMSGTLIGHLLEGVLEDKLSDGDARRIYVRWTTDLFHQQTVELGERFATPFPLQEG